VLYVSEAQAAKGRDMWKRIDNNAGMVVARIRPLSCFPGVEGLGYILCPLPYSSPTKPDLYLIP
jgi:hypothetical protein